MDKPSYKSLKFMVGISAITLLYASFELGTRRNKIKELENQLRVNHEISNVYLNSDSYFTTKSQQVQENMLRGDVNGAIGAYKELLKQKASDLSEINNCLISEPQTSEVVNKRKKLESQLDQLEKLLIQK